MSDEIDFSNIYWLAAIAFVSVALVVLALFLDDPEPRQASAPARAEVCK